MNENKKPSQYTAFSNVFFVLKYLFRINKKLYLCRIPLTLLNIFSPLLNAYLFSILINELTTEANVKYLLMLILLFSSVNLAISLLHRSLVKFDCCEKEKTVLNIKLDLGKTVSKMPFSEIETPRIKDFISLARDTTLFSRTMDATMSFIGSLIAVPTYASVLINIQPWLILAIAINLLVQLIFGRLKLKDNDKWRIVQEPIFRKLWYYEELLCDPRYGKELRVNCLQSWISQKANFVYEGECAPIVKTNAKNITILDLIAQIFKIAELIFIYSFLSIKVIFDGMLIGDFTFYLSNATNFSNALNTLTNNVLELKECGTFIREFRFFNSFRQKQLFISCSEKHINDNDYSIEFKHVSFKYPNTDRYVLKDISFKIQQGDKLSLVGVNGSGKTTLVKLLCRFYEPTEGVISIGGVDICKYDLKDYNKLLGVVFQDFKLFSFSIKENVTMGEQEDSDHINSCL
jgi:ABC-type multidrug transport system fused ATPase/permease subunit